MGLGVTGGTGRDRGRFRGTQATGDGAGDLARDVVLEDEQVLCGPVIRLAPCSKAVRSVDETHDDAHPRSGAPQAPFHQISDSECATRRDPVVGGGLPQPPHSFATRLLDLQAANVREP